MSRRMMLSAASASTIDPYWGSVALLLQMDGPNASTTFVDSSPSPKTISSFGNSKISTAQSKFGGSSGLFDGSGDYLSVNPAISLSSGDFTFEYFVYFSSTLSSAPVLSRRSGTSGYWVGSRHSAGNFQVTWQQWAGGATGYELIDHVCTGVHTLNSWVHVCFERVGDVLTAYTDGIARASITSAWRPAAPDVLTYVSTDGGAIGASLNSYLDSLRITLGVARYNGNFTPPTTQFPTS